MSQSCLLDDVGTTRANRALTGDVTCVMHTLGWVCEAQRQSYSSHHPRSPCGGHMLATCDGMARHPRLLVTSQRIRFGCDVYWEGRWGHRTATVVSSDRAWLGHDGDSGADA